MSTTFSGPSDGALSNSHPGSDTSKASASCPSRPKRITVPAILRRKAEPSGSPTSRPLVSLTAYDFTTAALLDSAGCVDVILIGDSLGGIVQGYETTIPVTLDEMVYHCRCVSRGVRTALVVGDMPFMSYQVSPEQALESAGRLVKEGGVSAVKLEGGAELAPTVKRLVAAGIPVMGHIGLTPQSFHVLGGHVRQGRTDEQRRKIVADAEALIEAGVFSLVLECIPADLAATITAAATCPTIGIGSGDACDGQILVINDLVGLRFGAPPPFVQQEASLATDLIAAVQRFAARVSTEPNALSASALLV